MLTSMLTRHIGETDSDAVLDGAVLIAAASLRKKAPPRRG